jgi:hypothetical protein
MTPFYEKNLPVFRTGFKKWYFLKTGLYGRDTKQAILTPFLTTYRVKDWRHESLRVFPSLFEKDPQNGAFKFGLFSSF